MSYIYHIACNYNGDTAADLMPQRAASTNGDVAMQARLCREDGLREQSVARAEGGRHTRGMLYVVAWRSLCSLRHLMSMCLSMLTLSFGQWPS